MYNSEPSEEILLTIYGKAAFVAFKTALFLEILSKNKSATLFNFWKHDLETVVSHKKNKAFRVSRVDSGVAPLARHEQSLGATGRQIDSWKRQKLRVQIWSHQAGG